MAAIRECWSWHWRTHRVWWMDCCTHEHCHRLGHVRRLMSVCVGDYYYSLSKLEYCNQCLCWCAFVDSPCECQWSGHSSSWSDRLFSTYIHTTNTNMLIGTWIHKHINKRINDSRVRVVVNTFHCCSRLIDLFWASCAIYTHIDTSRPVHAPIIICQWVHVPAPCWCPQRPMHELCRRRRTCVNSHFYNSTTFCIIHYLLLTSTGYSKLARIGRANRVLKAQHQHSLASLLYQMCY